MVCRAVCRLGTTCGHARALTRAFHAALQAMLIPCLIRPTLWLQVALRKVGRARPGWLVAAAELGCCLVAWLPGGSGSCATAGGAGVLRHSCTAFSSIRPARCPKQILKKYDKQKGGQRGRAFLQHCWRLPAGGAFLHSPLLDGALMLAATCQPCDCSCVPARCATASLLSGCIVCCRTLETVPACGSQMQGRLPPG